MNHTTQGSNTLTRYSYTALMHRLSQAGFKNEFVRPAILPDWWDESCAEDPELLQDFEIRVARFLGLPMAAVRDTKTPLFAPTYPNARLRHVRDVDRERLGPAIHSALRIAAAVVRCLRDTVPNPGMPLPPDGLSWRNQIMGDAQAVTLDDILHNLWLRGIPVIPLDLLPSPSFQGIACIVDDRPVILVGHKHDEPGRVAFLLAHEAGHIASGDCRSDQPVIDKEDEIVDNSNIEKIANRYASLVLVGDDEAPQVAAANYRQLAERAYDLEVESGADASFIISAWAAQTGDYAKATMAIRALYRAVGARQKLQKYFAQHVDFDIASESDRNLLRCVYAGAERDGFTR